MATAVETKAFAVIKTGGKQYKVSEGDVIKIEKLGDVEAGKKVSFDEVLLVDDGSTAKVGSPTIKGAKVEGEVMQQGRHKKVIAVRYKSKSNYFKRYGHRQPFTEVKITKI